LKLLKVRIYKGRCSVVGRCSLWCQ